MKKIYLLFIMSLLSVVVVAQCTVTGSVAQPSLLCGNCTQLSAYGQGQGLTVFSEDFDIGTYGPGWQSGQQAMWNNPCSPGGVNGTTHVWMGNSSPVPRFLTTQGYDLTPGVAGVTICFDMMFATQGEAAPCEGPDEPDEGVYLQYSTDGGSTWQDIHYFDPNGGYDTQFTEWNNWCFQLPAAAISSNTMIRWYQVADSGADYDHWGIDNVVIYFNDPTYQITWLHDGYNLGAVGGVDPNPVCPHATTSYVVQMTNGTSYCYDTVEVVVTPPVIDVNVASDQTICNGDCANLTGTATVIVSPAKTPTYENNEISAVTGGHAEVNINITDLNMTQVLPGSITQVCINSFTFTGTQICTNFSGCNCNGATISMGSTCNLNTASFNVYLNGPNGCQILLVPQYEASGSAYTNVCFVPAGGQNITLPSFPTSGNWASSQPLSGLDGCDANGVWSLEFDAPGGLGFGVGSLTGWSITFNDPEISYQADYAWSPTSNMTGSNTLTPQVCPTTTTTYTLTASDTAGCASVPASATISVSSCSFSASVNSESICPGACTNISATVSTGVGPYSYAWSNGLPATAGPHNVCPSSNTTYSVTITDNGNGGATATASGTVTVHSSPTANAGSDQSICSGASVNLIASGGTGYAWSNGGSTTAANTVSPTSTTTYTVTVTDANTCTDTDDVTVTVNSIPTGSAGPDQTICSGVSTTLTASGGISYLWSTTETTASITVSPTTNTTYYVTVTATGGCTATDDITVTIGANLSVPITVSPNDTVCIGGQAILTASGADTYTWSNGATTASITVSPLAPTTYTVTGTSNGCTGSSHHTIEVEPNPTANAGNDVSICAGASTTLNASGGVFYVWSNGTTTANNSVNPTTTTTYTVTVATAFGCTDTDEVLVTVNSVPTANAGIDQTICSGESATLTGSGGGSYAWSNGSSSAQITVNPTNTTTYTLTVTSAGSCSSTDNVTVTVTPSVNVSATASPASICAGQSSTLTAVGATNYSWSNGSNTASITVNPASTTTYTVTGTSGTCSSTGTVTVSVFPIPSASAGPDHNICLGGSATLTASGIGSFLWSTGATTQSITVSPTLTTNYSVTVTNTGNCSSSDNAEVRVNNPPTASAGADQTICSGSNATLTASGGDSYLWNTGSTNASINVNPSSTTTYSVTVYNSSGCSSTDNVTVSILPSVHVDAEPLIHLCNGSVDFINPSVTGGTSPYQYFWNGSPGNNVLQVNSAGNYELYVIDDAGCRSNTVTTVVTVTPPVQLEVFAVPSSVCPGESVMINVSITQGSGGPYTIIHNGQTINPPFTVYPHTTGNYIFSVEDNCGSTDQESVAITVYPEPVISFNSDTTFGCQPLTVNFHQYSNVPIISSVWNFGDNSSDHLSLATHPSHTFHNSGNFDVSLTVTSENGCKSTLTQEEMIEVFPLPDSRYITSPELVSIIKPEVQFTNLSLGAESYVWHFGDGDSSSHINPVHYYGNQPNYYSSLIAISSHGCKDTSYLTIKMNEEFTFYAPSAFSPDGNGINDIFYVTGVGIDPNNFNMIIYDRWGQIQFETDKYFESYPEFGGWNGTSKSGKSVPVGTYTWIVVFKNSQGIKKEVAGTVSVIR